MEREERRKLILETGYPVSAGEALRGDIDIARQNVVEARRVLANAIKTLQLLDPSLRKQQRIISTPWLRKACNLPM